jgi:protease I
MSSQAPLQGKKIAVLAEALYEDLELWYPAIRMKEAGAQVKIVGSGSNTSYKGRNGLEVKPDLVADNVKAADFDAVIIPGGVAPDYMRRYPAVVSFVREMNDEGKVVAAICHAGSLLVSTGILKGRTMTCFKSIKDDVVNAGANYVDREVVVDRNLITSRTPDDLPAFARTIISTLIEVPLQIQR